MVLAVILVLGLSGLIALVGTLLVQMRGQCGARRVVLRLLLVFLGLGAYMAVKIGASHVSRLLDYDPATRQRFTALIRTNDHQAVLAAAVPVIWQLHTNVVLIRQRDITALLPMELVQLQPAFVRLQEKALDLVFVDSRGKFGFTVSRAHNGWELAWFEQTPGRLDELEPHPLAVQADKS
jgi:hypothetical protein